MLGGRYVGIWVCIHGRFCHKLPVAHPPNSGLPGAETR